MVTDTGPSLGLLVVDKTASVELMKLMVVSVIWVSVMFVITELNMVDDVVNSVAALLVDVGPKVLDGLVGKPLWVVLSVTFESVVTES